jgi:hypothetical protein
MNDRERIKRVEVVVMGRQEVLAVDDEPERQKLPRPHVCPSCAGFLSHGTRRLRVLKRNRKFGTVPRPVHFCLACRIVVVVHRLPAELEAVAKSSLTPGSAKK